MLWSAEVSNPQQFQFGAQVPTGAQTCANAANGGLDLLCPFLTQAASVLDPECCIFPKFNEDGCRIKDRRQRISPHGAGTPENLPLGISHCPTAHLAVCAVCAKVGCISANARTNFIRLSQIHISQSLSLTSSISVLCRGLGEVSADPTFGLPLCHGTAKFVTRRFAPRGSGRSKPSKRCISMHSAS